MKNRFIKLAMLLCVLLVTTLMSTQSFASKDYTLFEVDPVRPVVNLKQGKYIAVLNVPDDYLELFKSTKKGVKHCASIKTGMRPVALAVVKETRHHARVWVVNHLSDSISVINLNLKKCQGSVVDTILVGDEPRDIVVANTSKGKRVFVTMAHRGQNHPDVLTRTGDDLVRHKKENEALNRPTGLADVVMFDAKSKTVLQIINLFSDTPRALALGTEDSRGFHQTIYASGFHTGNKTTTIAAENARGLAVEHLQALMKNGDILESNGGELVIATEGLKMHGGTPAVAGSGRCSPDPRTSHQRRHEIQICTHTDDQNNILSIKPQVAGVIDESCSCFNAYGEVQPVISLIVKFYADPDLCGDDYSPAIQGCWLDQDPLSESISTPTMAWNDSVKFSLPDNDVFKLSIDSNGRVSQSASYSGVGTVLFGMTVHPKTGEVYVANQDSNNLTRFEGFGHFSNSTVRGNITESQISILTGNEIKTKNLNDHLDGTSGSHSKATSVAFPVAITMTKNKNHHGKYKANQTLYFLALGSDKVAYISTSELNSATAGEVNDKLKYLKLSKLNDEGDEVITGPVGLSLDKKRKRLYVLSRFTNELIVINVKHDQPKIMARYVMHSPEPESITAGRSTLYYATNMSANGDQACASCHIYGNNDSLAWDLGNPDIASVNSPGPFISPPSLGFVSDLSVDPEGLNPVHATVNPDFRSNKGPMITQPLKGLSNHGAMHWRGDRVRRVQFTVGENPNTGPLDEKNSITEFDEAVVGLVGGDQPLDEEEIDALAEYLLQVNYPPNPIRPLDNTLTDKAKAGRAVFFGCQSMTDQQFEDRVCVGNNGEIVEIDPATKECECVGNTIRFVMQRLLYIQDFATAFSTFELSLPTSAVTNQDLIEALQQSFEQLQVLAEQISMFERTPLSSFATAGNLAGSNSNALIYDNTQLDSLQTFATGLDYPENTGGLLAFVQLAKNLEQRLGVEILNPLLSQLPQDQTLPAELFARLTSVDFITGILVEWFGDANVSRKPIFDAVLAAGEEENTLRGCGLTVTEQSCPLRIADSLTTCQGCHVLDEDANREYGIDFPGFFGTGGEYAFSNIPQVLKIPHLRNLYARVGKFGQAHEFDMFVGQSVFGIRQGGFFDRKTPVVGPSVRGYGYSHDGSADTIHRFAGLLDFLKRPAGTLGADDVRGNPDALDAFLPEDPNACMGVVVTGKDEFFGALQADPAELGQAAVLALGGDESAAQQIVQAVLTSGASAEDPRWQAITASVFQAMAESKPVTKDHIVPIIEAVASALFCPNVPSPELMPLCFQLGSTLELGDKNGICYPSGLKERDAAEAYMLTFDTNVKPMVGQQITLKGQPSELEKSRFDMMISSAAAGHCDVGAWTKKRGYLALYPNAEYPMYTLMVSDKYQFLLAKDLIKRKKQAVTFTCYPPQEHKHEAYRSVLDRDRDGILNGFDKPKKSHKKHQADNPLAIHTL